MIYSGEGNRGPGLNCYVVPVVPILTRGPTDALGLWVSVNLDFVSKSLKCLVFPLRGIHLLK